MSLFLPRRCKCLFSEIGTTRLTIDSNENNGNNTRDLELLTLQLARQIIEANQSLAAQQRQISELKNNLVAQDRSQHGRNQFPDHKASGQFSINNNPGYNRSIRRSAARPYEPAMPVDPHNTGHPSRRAYTPPVLPPQTPPPRQAGKKKGRHHRTATPEQRQLRALTNGRPVYTLGIDPQTDRGLICDFFEQIKSWSAAYTVQLGALATEKIQELATNAGLVGYLGTALQFSKMIMEPDMLKSIVSAIVSRYVFAYTVGEHAMFLSRHIDANVCERLNQAWAQLSDHEHEKKVELLALQRDIYTRIKGAEDFKDWRTTCAKDFTTQLLSKLNGFLITNLPFTTAKDRDHRLQELFVKGYRIGFRLRMEAVWQFTWPIPGDQLQPAIMVNESRNLYGDMITTMREVMNSPNEHCVRFAVSPTMIKTDFSAGGEKKEVVHSALVHISPKRWL